MKWSAQCRGLLVEIISLLSVCYNISWSSIHLLSAIDKVIKRVESSNFCIIKFKYNFFSWKYESSILIKVGIGIVKFSLMWYVFK